jgi:hypothetical protein
MPLENLTPATRIEAYLAKIAGEDIITPEVKTRIEYYLNEIAQNGGGGGAGLPAVTEADNGKILGVVGGEWDKMDKGWNVTNIYNTFVEEQTVAVTSDGSYNGGVILNPSENELVEGQTYTVVIDGVEYTLKCQSMEGSPYLGEANGYTPDLTNYPFFIYPTGSDTLTFFTTLDVGNHTVAIVQPGKEVTTTDDFDAVRGYSCSKNTTEIIDDHATVQSGSWEDIQHINPLEEGKTYTVVINNQTYQRQLTGPTEEAMVLAQYPDNLYNGWMIGAPQDGVSSYFFTAPQDGSFDIHVYEETIITETSADFDSAVQSVKGVNVPLMVHGTYVDDNPYFEGDGFEYTYEQLAEIVDSGRPVYLRTDRDFIRAVVSAFDLHIQGFDTLDNVALIIHEEELGQKVLKARFTIIGTNTSTSGSEMCVMEMYQYAGDPSADINIVWPSGE